jgi:hypothetical protein
MQNTVLSTQIQTSSLEPKRKDNPMNNHKPTRRKFIEESTQLAAGALATGVVMVSTDNAQAQQPPAPAKKLNILMRSSWGTDDPTRASFVFSHGLALSDAGHNVQIFLTAERRI